MTTIIIWVMALNSRTDLAVEKIENMDAKIKGIRNESYLRGAATVTKIYIESSTAAACIGKPIGEYITAEIPDILSGNTEEFDEISEIIAKEISDLLPDSPNTVLIIGLGNRDITPDALGPKTTKNILATRHISDNLAREIGLDDIKKVAVLSPGVLGQTGIEVGEILIGICDRIKPSAIIAIDALAANGISRLGRTVQISNSGITPGSGVCNSRFEISARTMKIPVISIGLPTVVCAASLLENFGGNKEALKDMPDMDMIVTPSNIDELITNSAKLLGYAINRATQPNIDFNILRELT